MSMVTQNVRKNRDHFEPEANLDPHAQRAMRGHLEQIDFAAYAANREIVARTLGQTDLSTFERLALAAAQARATWVAAAVDVSTKAKPSPDDVNELAHLRAAYEELTEAYEAMRRLVERGYVAFKPRA
jgi:predicted lipid-binding transport protein (Tim44 family)